MSSTAGFSAHGESAGQTSSERYQRVATVVAVVVVALGVALTVARVFFGVDFIDEAFYAATAYRFALGARPFLSDLDAHQLAGWLVSPWVRLHVALLGNTTGLMLSLRLLWLLLDAGAASLSFLMLRRLVDARLAAVSAVCGFAVIPVMIPAPSYNTLGMLFLSASLSLVGIGLLGGRRGYFVVGGVAMGLGVVAYPTLALCAVAAAIGAGLVARSWRQPALFAAGGAGVALVTVTLMVPSLPGLPEVVKTVGAMAAMNGWAGAAGGPAGRVVGVLIGVGEWAVMQPVVWLATALAVLRGLGRRVPWVLAVAVPIAVPLSTTGGEEMLTLSLCSGLLIAAAVATLTSRQAVKSTHPVMRLVLSVGVIAGLTFGFTSGLGPVLFGLGAASVAATAVAVLVGLACESLPPDLAKGTAMLEVALAALVLVSFISANWVSYYQDGPPLSLGTLVRAGPQAGLLTTPETAVDSEALWRAVRRASSSKDRVFSYYGLPAGYLFAEGTPVGSLLYFSARDSREVPVLRDRLLSEVSSPDTGATLVIRNLGWPNAETFAASRAGYLAVEDPLDRYIRDHFRVVSGGRAWELLKLDSSP